MNNLFYKFDFILPNENQFVKLKFEKYKLWAWLIFFFFFYVFFLKQDSSKSLVIFTNFLIKTPKILGMRKK